MKKLLFLTFILTACAVQNELANGNTATPPESGSPGSSEPTPPDSSIQTTRDEWIRLVRGNYIVESLKFNNDGNVVRGQSTQAQLCRMVTGQNKAVYKERNYGWTGYALKDSTLMIFSKYTGPSCSHPWPNPEDVLFDRENPEVTTVYYTLVKNFYTAPSIEINAWINNYSGKKLTPFSSELSSYLIDKDGNLISENSAHSSYIFVGIDDQKRLYFKLENLNNAYFGGLINNNDNSFTLFSLISSDPYLLYWGNPQQVLFDTYFPQVRAEEFIIN